MKIKPNKVKSFRPKTAWDSRGKDGVSFPGTNWMRDVGWVDCVKSFEILFPGLIRVNWKEPNLYPDGDMYAIYDAKIELK